MRAPSHIGQYRIIREIGAGGMGQVYLGEHMLLGRRAAIKTLLPTVAVNKELVERFFNEARATSAISDPGVIQIFDFGYHVDGTAYIVMELLEGEALASRIERLGKLAPAHALRIARQLAGSLAAAHAHGIVHRDLKPENIFLVGDAEAQGGERSKILDFGICKVGATMTLPGARIGTPVYMSPEQCLGSSDVDHRSDIYAFGCLLFHMLTGRPPFVADAPGDLIEAHLDSEPPVPSDLAELPPEIDALLLRCLAKSPADRYQSMTELQQELAELAAQLGTAEAAVSSAPPAMLLGEGFRSMYVGSPRTGISQDPPMIDRLRHKLQFASSSSTLDDEELDPLPARRTGLRTALACIVIAGVALGLIAMSAMRHGDGDEPRSAGPPLPQAALPIEAAPSPAAAGDRVAAEAPRPSAPAERATAAPEAATAQAPTAHSATAESAKPEPPTAEASKVEPSRTEPSKADPSKAELPKVELSKAEPLKAEPSKAEPSAARSSREVKVKKAPVRPRSRPEVATPRPVSPASEDLYDTR